MSKDSSVVSEEPNLKRRRTELQEGEEEKNRDIELQETTEESFDTAQEQEQEQEDKSEKNTFNTEVPEGFPAIRCLDSSLSLLLVLLVVQSSVSFD